MNPWDRVALYRQRAAEMEQKASESRTQETKRAYLIIANDWRKMAMGLELKFLEASEVTLAPAKQVAPAANNTSHLMGVGPADQPKRNL